MVHIILVVYVIEHVMKNRFKIGHKLLPISRYFLQYKHHTMEKNISTRSQKLKNHTRKTSMLGNCEEFKC